jgi:hypothetical protein
VLTVIQLPAGKALTVRAAADVFLDSLGNPTTVRNYGIGVGETADRLGKARPLVSVADDGIGEALELLWRTAAVNTWNSRRAGVPSCGPGSVGAVSEATRDRWSRPGRSGWRCRTPRPGPARRWRSSG